MANVKFKRGTQAALNTLIKGSGNRFEDGSFYLTTDTDRLYVAQSATELVELNKSITIVNAVSGLPTATSDQAGINNKEINGADVAVGQFYYVKAGASSKSGNILAVCSDIASNGVITWTQVNPDTDTNNNDNTQVTSISATKNASSDNTQLIFDLSIGQTTSHVGATDTVETPITGQLTIQSADVTGILTNTAVDVENSAVSSNKTTISTSGSGASGNGFSIEGGSNVTLSDTTTGFKIDAVDTKYTIASPAVANSTSATSAAINLGINNGNETGGGSINVKVGEDLAINNTTANEFTIYHKNSGATAGQYGVSASATPIAGGKIKVPNITIDAQGHVTTAADQEITLPADNNTYVGSITAGNDGKLSITHTGSASNTVTSSTAVLFYNITVDGTQNTVNNQNSLGSFYSAAKVDELLRGINAIVYKGTVFGTNPTVASLPTTGVHIGDAYLANADSSSYHKGDLIIATAAAGKTEGSDGTLAAADIVWTVVPSGSDSDTYEVFSVDASNNKVTYHTSVSATEKDLVGFIGGTDIALSTSGTNITINHDAVTRNDSGTATATPTTTLAAGSKFKAITDITSSAQGHITAARFTEFTLPTDSDTTYTMSVTSGTPTINLVAGGSGTGNKGAVSISSSSLTVSAPSANTIAVDLEWGSF